MSNCEDLAVIANKSEIYWVLLYHKQLEFYNSQKSVINKQ